MEMEQQEHEHEVYGVEIPDEGEMDADAEDVDMASRPEDESDPNSKNIEDMRKRLKEIEEEAGALREMQAKVEKEMEMGAVQGVPWSEEEHRTFLAGLEKLGKGDWRGIAKQFVTTRTPTQVASHAQKYFLRQAACDKRKRRPSLFDMPLDPAAQPLKACSDSPPKRNVNQNLNKVNISAQHVVNPIMSSLHMEAPPILPMAACGVPYMMGVTALPETKVIPGVSYIPMANFSGTNFICLPSSHRSFTTSLLSTSRIPASRAASTNQKDSLKLSIRPPENQKGPELSPPTSGAIRVI